MPLIEVDFTEDYEDKTAPEGRYDLRISSAKEKTSQSGYNMVEAMLTVEGDEGVGIAPIFHYLIFPKADTEEKTKRMFMQNLTRFIAAFDVPHDKNGFNVEDMIGCTASEIPVIQEERGDMPGVMSAKIRLPIVNPS